MARWYLCNRIDLWPLITWLLRFQICWTLTWDGHWHWDRWNTIPLTTVDSALACHALTMLALCYLPGVMAAYIQLSRWRSKNDLTQGLILLSLIRSITYLLTWDIQLLYLTNKSRPITFYKMSHWIEPMNGNLGRESFLCKLRLKLYFWTECRQ